MAIVGIDLQNGNLDEEAESVLLLRSLLPDGKVVLVAETDGRIDPQRVLALLHFQPCTDQPVFVFAKSIYTSSPPTLGTCNPTAPLGSESMAKACRHAKAKSSPL